MSVMLITPEELGAMEIAEYFSCMVRDFYNFIDQIQKPKPSDENWRLMVEEYCTELTERLSSTMQNLTERQAAMAGVMEDMMENLRRYANDASEAAPRKRLKEVGEQISRNYEEMVVWAKRLKWEPQGERARLYRLKPTNYARTGFHIAMGLTGLLLYQFVLDRSGALWILGIISATAITLESTRLISKRWNDILVDKVFGAIARPEERHHINAATLYTIALFLVAFLAPKPAVQGALLALALGDPAASIVGRTWGSFKIWRQKSLAGTLGFFGVTAISIIIYSVLALDSISMLAIIGFASTTAAVGAVAELFSDRINDNFTIPIICAGVGSFWFF